MYDTFFSFKEKPFKLVPNPAYLFLSKSHEEALAHLSFAVSQGDGFVEIIGEVGTGKTTLCRAFLDNLEEGVVAGYIFNPKLDGVQLLKAINDEFGIDAVPATVKELIDILNTFLMAQKAAGKKVILLIDEAQNLSKDVLEQLRLLSNLETTREKLLQIILVGQPELAEVLDSHELRQLGQRITLSCRLTPLTLTETQQYIIHRLTVASCRPGVKFDLAAIKAIHHYAGGVPRLINIAADRALLTAYGLNSLIVTREIARMAIAELSGRGRRATSSWLQAPNRTLPLLAAFGLVCLVGLLSFWLSSRSGGEVRPTTAVAGFSPESLPAEGGGHLAEDGEGGGAGPAPQAMDAGELRPLRTFLAAADYRASRRLALQAALGAWKPTPVLGVELDSLADDLTYFRLRGAHNGLSVRRVVGDFALLRRLDLPAVLELHIAGHSRPRYAAVSGAAAGSVLLTSGEVRLEVTEEKVAALWHGIAYVPWNNFLHLAGTIPRDAPPESVLNLKMLLRELGHGDIAMTPDYDGQCVEIVKGIQRKYGLTPDGKVGPLTKIILYREAGGHAMPRVFSAGAQGAGGSS